VLKRLFLTLAFGLVISHFVKYHHVDKPLQPYVNEYMNLVTQSCTPKQYWVPKKTSIYLSNLSQDVIGECDIAPDMWQIKIDKTFFTYTKDEERFQVIAHELRHCLFLVGHVSDPNNYMAPMFPNLTMRELLEQINADLKASCQ
jgi:hypothetical protein